jgi:hypothetical protein
MKTKLVRNIVRTIAHHRVHHHHTILVTDDHMITPMNDFRTVLITILVVIRQNIVRIRQTLIDETCPIARVRRFETMLVPFIDQKTNFPIRTVQHHNDHEVI